MRLTAHRQEIIDLLSHTEGLRSATDIHASLPHINLVTIYRALEALCNAGLVKKLTLTDTEAVYEVQHEPHHHAVCFECGEVIHFTADDAALKREFHLPNFSVSDLSLTLYGHCKKHKLHKH